MTLLSAQRLYTGKVLNLDLDRVEFPDGSTGELEMIRHPGAAAVVPLLDPLPSPDPRVVLIRQFRHAANGVVWEVPAGRLDPGELPEHCARRELEEETGYRAAQYRHLTTIYTTPGFTDERIHLYLASDLTAGPTRQESDEFLEVQALPLSEAIRKVESGAIVDGKTIAALLFVHAFVTKT